MPATFAFVVLCLRRLRCRFASQALGQRPCAERCDHLVMEITHRQMGDIDTAVPSSRTTGEVVLIDCLRWHGHLPGPMLENRGGYGGLDVAKAGMLTPERQVAHETEHGLLAMVEGERRRAVTVNGSRRRNGDGATQCEWQSALFLCSRQR